MRQIKVAGCGCHVQESRVENGKSANVRWHFKCLVGRHHSHGNEIRQSSLRCNGGWENFLSFLFCCWLVVFIFIQFKFIHFRFEWKSNWPFLIGSTRTSERTKTSNTCCLSVQLVGVSLKKSRMVFYSGT